jgi:NodT family efflux transporter outer membrane factor (OMF) lipoprotein
MLLHSIFWTVSLQRARNARILAKQLQSTRFTPQQRIRRCPGAFRHIALVLGVMTSQHRARDRRKEIMRRGTTQRPLRPGPCRSALALAAALALASCAVGPDFKTPDLPAAAQGPDYTPTPVPAKTAQAPVAGGQAQEWAQGADISAQWWSVFHSEPLDALIQSALAHSPTLASAQATLRQAQENYRAQVGNLQLPKVDAQLGAERELASALTTETGHAQLLTLYNAAVNVSYTLDVFGGVRRQVESAQAALEAQRYQVEAAYLTLTGNVVTTAIREASLRAQLQATREVLASQQQQLGVLEKQFDTGATPKSVVLAQRTELAQTLALLPGLEKSLAQTRHQLAVYAGRLPSETGLPEFSLDSLQLPQTLPLSLPSELARQRPDVRASEALLHQASAQVGVATANLYPQIQLTASYGSTALRGADLFSGGWNFWSLAGGLSQPLFHGGALTAQRRAAIAGFDAAAAQYRNTLLVAFQNVADALRALEFDAATLKSQADAENIAKQSLDMSTAQYRAGAVSYVQLLTAQQAWLQTHTALVQAQAARYADTAALFQSLGGTAANWPMRPSSPRSPHRTESTPTDPRGEPFHDEAHDHHDRLRAGADRCIGFRQVFAGQATHRLRAQAWRADGHGDGGAEADLAAAARVRGHAQSGARRRPVHRSRRPGAQRALQVGPGRAGRYAAGAAQC